MHNKMMNGENKIKVTYRTNALHACYWVTLGCLLPRKSYKVLTKWIIRRIIQPKKKVINYNHIVQ